MLAGFTYIQCYRRQQYPTLFDQTASDIWARHIETLFSSLWCFLQWNTFSLLRTEGKLWKTERENIHYFLRGFSWYIFGEAWLLLASINTPHWCWVKVATVFWYFWRSITWWCRRSTWLHPAPIAFHSVLLNKLYKHWSCRLMSVSTDCTMQILNVFEVHCIWLTAVLQQPFLSQKASQDLPLSFVNMTYIFFYTLT